MFRNWAVALSLFVLALGAWPGEPRAHPHAWIDTSVRVLFNSSGDVIGLRQTWLFDDFYSMFVVEGADMNRDGKPDQAALEAVMNENLKNLSEFNYFTEVKRGEDVLSTGLAFEAETRMLDTRLEVTFTVPLEQPVSPAEIPVSYMIFDPTYYVEMLHPDKGDPIELVDAPSSCTTTLVRPKPSEEDILYAASLGQFESGGDTLGRLFAEEVRITCG